MKREIRGGRAATLVDFAPADGQQVELRGRLGVYEARGELRGGFAGLSMMHPTVRAAGSALPSALTPVYPTVAQLPQPYLRKAVLAGLAQADLSNALPGPWDRQQLPLDQLKARARYAGGQWIIESLDAVAAGGRILAQAQSVPTASNPPKGTEAPALAWDARATLQRVNPAAADSRLAAASLNGQLTARIARQAWTFDADLTGAPLQGGPPGASAIRQRLKALRAQGRWEGGTLTLPALLLQTDDTQLQGSLTFHLERRSGDARLNLSLPGGTVTLAGQISESQGAGALAAQVTDASLAARWLASWPGMPTQWAQGTMRGSAALNATWKGGWKEQGRQLQVQAQLAVPRLDLGAPGAAPTQVWQVSDGQFDLTGTLASLRLNTRGRAQAGTRRLELAAAAQAGHLGDGAWRAQAAADGGVGGPGPAIALALQPAAETGLRLARTLAVPRSPQVQVAVVARQVDARGAHAGIDHTGAAVVELHLEVALGALKRCANPHRRSHREIPLAGEHHVLGQVVLRQGQAGQPVDPAQGQSLNTALRTPLGGRCVAPAPTGRLPLDAGLARLGPGQPKIASRHLQRARQGRVLPVHGHALAQPQGPGAGLQAVLGLELQRLDLRAQLPRLRAWSALTPPGWRIRGTLQADATLAGTRAAPQWGGTIAADNLAARSIVNLSLIHISEPTRPY